MRRRHVRTVTLRRRALSQSGNLSDHPKGGKIEAVSPLCLPHPRIRLDAIEREPLALRVSMCTSRLNWEPRCQPRKYPSSTKTTLLSVPSEPSLSKSQRSLGPCTTLLFRGTPYHLRRCPCLRGTTQLCSVRVVLPLACVLCLPSRVGVHRRSRVVPSLFRTFITVFSRAVRHFRARSGAPLFDSNRRLVVTPRHRRHKCKKTATPGTLKAQTSPTERYNSISVDVEGSPSLRGATPLISRDIGANGAACSLRKRFMRPAAKVEQVEVID